MSPSPLHTLPALPRRLYRRSQALRGEREERRFVPRLRHDASAPELLLSPHCDDAVLDCWSLLASPRELVVVTMFAGLPAPGRLAIWDAITGAQDSCERARARLDEDARAVGRAGREPLQLTLLDAQYRTGSPDPDLAAIDHAVSGAVASASRVHVPAGIGAHLDHLLVRRYGRMLLRAGLPVTLYAELPYCVLHGWPSWVDGREPEPARNVDAFWGSFLDGLEEMPPLRSARVQRLDAATADAKLEAMRCYETQLPCLSYGGRGLLEDPAIHGFETAWELDAAPRAQGATG